MSRYRLQEQNAQREWINTPHTFNTKSQLDEHIGQYGIDYEYRVGFFFKPYTRPCSRFVWDTPAKKGQEVKV